MEKTLLDMLRSPRAEMTPEEDGGGCVEAPMPPCADRPDEGRPCVGHEGCGCNSWGLADYPLAMVYAPCQVFRSLYDPATALSRGTLFTELDLPLGNPSGASCRIRPRD